MGTKDAKRFLDTLFRKGCEETRLAKPRFILVCSRESTGSLLYIENLLSEGISEVLPHNLCNCGKAVGMLNCLTAINISQWMCIKTWKFIQQ